MSILAIAGFAAYAFFARSDAPAAATPLKASSTDTQPSTPAATSPAPTTVQTTTTTNPSALYKDGVYTGDSADAYYGFVQIRATVQGGRLADVTFLSYPNDRQTSVMINSQAMPMLQHEAIQTQTARVDIISGATDTSQAFIQSLGSALIQARLQ